MYSTLEIASFIGAQIKNLKGYNIDWLLTDSRSLCYPESTLFFAIKTDRGNGHRYIADLYQRGVRAFVISEVPKGDFPNADFLFVPDTLQALQDLAAEHRSKFSEWQHHSEMSVEINIHQFSELRFIKSIF